MTDKYQQHTLSVLATLRSVIPRRSDVTYDEALRIAELQANKLLAAHAISEGSTPTELISELPKITIAYTGALVAGASYWDTTRRTWVILLSRADSWQRQRFTLAHEYKHIIDHGRSGDLYRGDRRASAATQAERVADYFAACVLMPRRALKRVWGNGMQRTDALAAYFQVSERAIGVRLRQTGLVDDWTRCTRADEPGGYSRRLEKVSSPRMGELIACHLNSASQQAKYRMLPRSAPSPTCESPPRNRRNATATPRATRSPRSAKRTAAEPQRKRRSLSRSSSSEVNLPSMRSRALSYRGYLRT